MKELRLKPNKYDIFYNYKPDSDIARILAYLFPQYPELLKIYKRDGVVAALEEVANNPNDYNLNTSDIENDVDGYGYSRSGIEECGYLPEQLYDTVLKLVKESKLPDDEITVDAICTLVVDSIWKDCQSGDVEIEDLFFFHGIVGLPGLFELTEVRDSLREMVYTAVSGIDMDEFKKQLGDME